MNATTSEDRAASRSGVAAGLIAYSLWGVFPVYFKIIEAVAPTDRGIRVAGVEPGEWVVTAGVEYLSEGQRVRFSQ